MAGATRKPAGDFGTADRVEADQGHYWVRLLTRQAYDREGACMGSCLGDGRYDPYAGNEDMADNGLWSLRRPDGVSVLTVEVQYSEIVAALGPRNSTPGRFESMQCAALAREFRAMGHVLSISEETGIVKMPDGRTCRSDRLPPEVAAARADAERIRDEQYLRSATALRILVQHVAEVTRGLPNMFSGKPPS